ncbi:MAG: tetratricopeptide repeat protein [Vicinamibacterales bacterium]
MVLVLGLLIPLTAAAQNREHLQMNADLRILQEQVGKLQLTANQLAEQLRATGRRLDEVADAGVKGFANQQLLINQITSSIGTTLEKLQDNNVRVSQLTQEFSAIRDGVRMLTEQINALVSLLQPPVSPSGAASGMPASGGIGPVPQPISPSRIYEQAESDYGSGRYENAIEGYTEFLQKFPNAADAASAQFYIGESYHALKKCPQAIQEYGKVISTYKDSSLVREAYVMQGVCYDELKQTTNARRALEYVRDHYPGTIEAAQAEQRLKNLSR